jgi:hypothetical protein
MFDTILTCRPYALAVLGLLLKVFQEQACGDLVEEKKRA